MADEDLIITVDSLDEPFDTTTERATPEGGKPVRITPTWKQNGQTAREASRPSPKDTDDAVESLRSQLSTAQRQTAELRQRVDASDHAARTAAAQVERARTIITDTASSALDTEIASATTETASIKAAMKAALDAGNYDQVTDLQEKMGDVRARLHDAKKRKEQLETEASVARAQTGRVVNGDARPAAQPAPQRSTRPMTKEERRQAILSRVESAASRAWLQEHEDILDDPVRGAEASLVHEKAIAAGLEPDSDEYFRFAEREMGYTKVNTNTRREQRTERVEAAPGDRGGGGAPSRDGGTRSVTLTQREKEAAETTVLWNPGPNVPKDLIGKPVGVREYARRKALMMADPNSQYHTGNI